MGHDQPIEARLSRSALRLTAVETGPNVRQLRHDVDDTCPIGPDGRCRHTYDYREGGCRQVKDVELTANLGWGTPWTGSALVLRRG